MRELIKNILIMASIIVGLALTMVAITLPMALLLDLGHPWLGLTWAFAVVILGGGALITWMERGR